MMKFGSSFISKTELGHIKYFKHVSICTFLVRTK